MSKNLKMYCPVNIAHTVEERFMFSNEKFAFCTGCKECTEELSRVSKTSRPNKKSPNVSDFREMDFQERFDLVASYLNFHLTEEFKKWPEQDRKLWEFVLEKVQWSDAF